MNYLITGLPRSRTAWLSAYLSAAGSKCMHEPFAYINRQRSFEDITAGCEGISDSTLLILPSWTDNNKTLIIERDPIEVVDSMVNKFCYAKETVVRQITKLHKAMQDIDGLRIPYREINSRIQEIHEYCTDIPYDPILADKYCNMNIQIIGMEYTAEFASMVSSYFDG